jgi:hypothetical protein
MLATLLRQPTKTTPETAGGPVSPKEAAKMIRQGTAPAGMRISGHLSLEGDAKVTALPPDLHVTRLTVAGCGRLTSLPPGLRCYELDAKETVLTSLPDDLRVEYKLDLSGCVGLQELPAGLKVGTLTLAGCALLQSLPEGLDVCFLDISGCAGLRGWPAQASVRIGRLDARGCAGLTTLPSWLTQVAQLDLRGCERLTSLPDGLRVTSWLDLADTGITSLPPMLAKTPLRWRGVPIDARIAFHPETITADEVLGTANAEMRRVLLERMGYEAFLSAAQAQVLDRDSDPGGERRLLRVPLSGDEALVCVAVSCPSTGRQYIIRVPPSIRTCHQASAWIAGFDNPNDYRPIAET